MRASLFATAFVLLPAIAPAGTLTTSAYRVTIEVRCPEGRVTCEDVKYTGISRTTGKSITLAGRTVHTIGADGVTPSRFLGYTFTNGNTTYFVSEGGELKVIQGSKVIAQETGVWKW